MGRLFIEADTGTEVSTDSTKLLNGDELATTVELSAPSPLIMKSVRTMKVIKIIALCPSYFHAAIIKILLS